MHEQIRQVYLEEQYFFFPFVINACKQNTLLLSCEWISVCARRHWAYQPCCDTPVFTRVNKLSVTCSKRLFFRRVKHFKSRLHYIDMCVLEKKL